MANKPLSSNDIHLMRLIRKDANRGEWASVSKAVWPFINRLPLELVEREEVGEGGVARLTDEGNTVLDWI